MDLEDPRTLELFLRVYGTLPRAGPGGAAHTLRALSAVPGEPPARVLDLGCGPGAATLDLAGALPEAEILALDLLPQMVDVARRRIEAAGLGERVRAEVGDMAAPPVEAGSQDLICCEGAIYNLGVRAGLEAWRSLLRPGASVFFTESIWLRPDPPEEIRQWWEAEYPAITDAAGVREAIAEAGYRTLDFFPLPAAAWWDDYYEPMQEAVATLARDLPRDPVAVEVVAMARKELEMFQRYSENYSYGCFVVQPA